MARRLLGEDALGGMRRDRQSRESFSLRPLPRCRAAYCPRKVRRAGRWERLSDEPRRLPSCRPVGSSPPPAPRFRSSSGMSARLLALPGCAAPPPSGSLPACCRPVTMRPALPSRVPGIEDCFAGVFFSGTGVPDQKYARAHEKRKPDRLVENSAIGSLPRVFTPD